MHDHCGPKLMLFAAALFLVLGAASVQDASAASERKTCIKQDCKQPKKSYLTNFKEQFRYAKGACKTMRNDTHCTKGDKQCKRSAREEFKGCKKQAREEFKGRKRVVNSKFKECMGCCKKDQVLCSIATCGDGITAEDEECDDGDDLNSNTTPDACRMDCTLARCGDGVTDSGEQCDAGGESATCKADCTQVVGAKCGDGKTDSGEQCDAGGESATCDADCTFVLCGDSVKNAAAGEQCDAGGESATCDANCTFVLCGDNTANATAGEKCDGTDVELCVSKRCRDDCSKCVSASCGDGVVNDADEECDDRGESATCDDDCTFVLCGDKTTNATAGEQCDDENSFDGDCCSSTCKYELEPSPCGQQGIECFEDDYCNGQGTCVDAGFSQPGTPCGVAGEGKECDGGGSCVCGCTGATRLGFTTGIAVGQPPAGTLSNYRCSNASSSACADNGNCDFRPCILFGQNFCAGNRAVPCTTDAQCQGTCAEVSSGNLPLALKVGSLYTGGGLNSVPLPLPVPDQGLAYTNVSTGDGQTLTLTQTTPAQVEKYNCTQGRTCSVGGAPCVVDGDCGAGTCVDNCIYGPQLPIPNAGTAATSVCVVNAVGVDASGSAQCDGGDSDLQIGLRSVIYLNGDLFKSSTPPDLPGVQPCPLCVPICSGGSNNGLPCRPANSNRACVGGSKVGKPCTGDGQCPSSTCAPARNELLACTSGGGSCPSTSQCLGGQNPGATCTPETSTSDLLGDAQDSYPTSHTCLLDPLQNITANIGGLPVALNMTTGTQEVNAVDRPNGARVFCGFCRDVKSGGTLRFQGDPSVGGDGNAVPCNDDSGCSAPFESCVQRNPGAFSEAGATRISVTGDSSGCLGDLNTHPGTLVSIFCVPPTFDATVDAAGDLPGPGAVLLYGEAQLE